MKFVPIQRPGPSFLHPPAISSADSLVSVGWALPGAPCRSALGPEDASVAAGPRDAASGLLTHRTGTVTVCIDLQVSVTW